jgi:hypothetical protein
MKEKYSVMEREIEFKIKLSRIILHKNSNKFHNHTGKDQYTEGSPRSQVCASQFHLFAEELL